MTLCVKKKMILREKRKKRIKEGKESESAMKVQPITIQHHGRKIRGTVYLPDKDRYTFVIFSHGFNGSGEDSAWRAKILAEQGIGVLTYDFCGGGLRCRSDLRTREMTIFTEVEDLMAVLDTVETWQAVDQDRIFLFGESMGGLVSALTAEKRAQEIKGLALLYPALCVADDWNRHFPELRDIPEIHGVWGVPLGRPFFETLHGFQVFEEIGKYPGRVMILHGDQDGVVPVRYSEKAREVYQDAHLTVFPGEGHGFLPAGSERVTQMLLEFLQQ